MSYINAIRERDEILVWERNENGREIKTYPAPYYFYVKDPKGKHKTIYGDTVRRYDFGSSHEFSQVRQTMQASDEELFESDLAPELKLLSEQYYNVPAPKLNVSFLDIEVDYDPEVGFASTANPYAPINSVAIYHTHTKEYIILAVPPNLAPHKAIEADWVSGEAPKEFVDRMSEIAPFMSDVDLKIHFCRNERELLLHLMMELQDSDVMCGWNSDFFDVPYIGKRLEKMGRKYFQMLSFERGRKPMWRTVEIYGTEQETLDPSGRISFDYMVLFKKYEMAERPSYKLEAIADEMLPDLPKLEYEGSLAQLYRDDFAYFVRYNIRDTEILHGLEDKLGYVEVSNQMMHLSTGLPKMVTGTLKLAELAAVNYCHHQLGGLVVNDITVTDYDGQIQGAFVLIPQTGMHENISSVDLASLYPSAIRSLNISPEKIIGQFERNVEAAEEIAKDSMALITLVMEDGSELEAPATEWRKVLKAKKWAVSGYGTVFDQNSQGIIPMILTDWYAQRKEYKKMMAQAKDAGEEQKAMYYDKLQYIYKIKLNSFYGALTNKYFRFYDLRMGESTTGTGRQVLLHQCAKACEILDGTYAMPDNVIGEDGKSPVGYSDKWSVIYGDTDSSYFVTHAKDPDEATIIGDRVAELINDSFQGFMQDRFLCTEGYDDIMSCEREVVSDRGIFVDKKRYILHLTDLDGWKVDKLKVMGLDTKKTTMPPEVSAKINSFVERLLKGEDWNDIVPDIVDFKDYITNTDDIMSIGLPKGVKKVEHYTVNYQRDNGTMLPGHVAASIFYNICRDEFNDKESMPIVSNMKIKVFYLNRKYGRFKSIAIPVDVEQVPSWFIENFTIDREAHVERLVDNPMNNIIKAVGYQTPSRQSMIVNDLLDF